MTESLPPAHAPPLTKLTVLISGSGPNLQALIDASTSGLLPSTTIVRVISNKKGVQGLTRAEKAGIPTAYHNLIFGKCLRSGEKDPNIIQKARAAYDADLVDLVLQDKPDLVVCAGWMHILASSFLEPLVAAHVPESTTAQTPSSETWEAEQRERTQRTEQEGQKYSVSRQEELEHAHTGVMVHYVIDEVDRGEPIQVEYVDFKPGESLEELAERIHKVEHLIIVKGTGLATVKLWEERRKKNMNN